MHRLWADGEFYEPFPNRVEETGAWFPQRGGTRQPRRPSMLIICSVERRFLGISMPSFPESKTAHSITHSIDSIQGVGSQHDPQVLRGNGDHQQVGESQSERTREPLTAAHKGVSAPENGLHLLLLAARMGLAASRRTDYTVTDVSALVADTPDGRPWLK